MFLRRIHAVIEVLQSRLPNGIATMAWRRCAFSADLCHDGLSGSGYNAVQLLEPHKAVFAMLAVRCCAYSAEYCHMLD